MIKVGFIEELNAGDRIVVRNGGREPVRLTGQVRVDRVAEVAVSKSNKLLRELIALRKRGGKD